MFKELEQRAPLDLSSFALSLPETCKEIKKRLGQKPILMIPYANVPPLFEREVLQGIVQGLQGEFQDWRDVLSGDLRVHSTLFSPLSPTRSNIGDFLLQVTRHLVETRGKCGFVFFLSDGLKGKLLQHPCYSILKPYFSTMDFLPENPAAFMAQATGLQGLYEYIERQLPKLLFFAAVDKLEGCSIPEADLQEIVSSIKLVEEGTNRTAYFSWYALPKYKSLLDSYMTSMGITSSSQQLYAQADEDFYLTKCFLHFAAKGSQDGLAIIREQPIPELLYRLRLRQRDFSQTSRIIAFLRGIAIAFHVSGGDVISPALRLSLNDFETEPKLRQELRGVCGLLEVDEETILDRRWSKVRDCFLDNIFTFVASIPSWEQADIEPEVQAILAELSSRVEAYDAEECKYLIVKTVAGAVKLEAAAALHNTGISGRTTAAFGTLWTRSVQKLRDGSVVMSSAEEQTLWKNLDLLVALNNAYARMRRDTFIQTFELTDLKIKLDVAAASGDPIEEFTRVFSEELLEHNFFLNVRELEQLAIALGKRHVELESNLLNGLYPFTVDFREGKDLTKLVLKLQYEDNFDRIFVLLIDAFSYLEWKLLKEQIVVGIEDVLVTEDYRIAPVPTYTPGNTTALVTGYHPSELGICDWKVRPRGSLPLSIIDDVPNTDVARLIGGACPPRITASLVHSYGSGGLTTLQKSLANVTLVPLHSTEYQKAITQAAEAIGRGAFQTKVVVVYIADFDEFGHEYLRLNGWPEYYAVQARSIRESLLKPIARRAQKTEEKTLAVLTADHGKLTRYESQILNLVTPRSSAFDECIRVIPDSLSSHSARHLVAWFSPGDLNGVLKTLEPLCAEKKDIMVLHGHEMKKIFPFESRTNLENPNLAIFSTVNIRGGSAMGHGGMSISEVVVPAIRFEWR